jgi:hypothetical protein
VLRAESHDAKTLVHDYGHGGGGMSLSWGTALLARDLALRTQKRRAAVIGQCAADRSAASGAVWPFSLALIVGSCYLAGWMPFAPFG